MEAIVQNLLTNAPVLVVFLGMMALVWKALNIAHDLATLALKGGVPAPQVAAVVPKEVAPVIIPKSPDAPPQPTPAAPIGAVDQGLVNFIKSKEGFSAKAYWDYKQWSIGYGTKATSSTEVITEAEGLARLHDEIAKANKLVTDVYPNLPKGIEQALTDLTYNAGSGWEHQSLGAAVKAEKWDTVKADILQYNHAGGVVNAGLTVRREDEVKWFDNPL